MGRVVGHDPAAFSELYDRYIAISYAVAYRAVRDAGAAEDACQEAFLAVWRFAASYDPTIGNVRSWVLQIVRNRAIDRLRRGQRISDRELTDPLLERHAASAGEQTEGLALRAVEDHQTRTLLDVLSDVQRRVIELSFYGGYSQSEISSMLDLPLGTVKARMLRGLTRMRAAAGNPDAYGSRGALVQKRRAGAPTNPRSSGSPARPADERRRSP